MKTDLHYRKIAFAQQTRRLLDTQRIDMLRERSSEILPEKLLKY